MEHYDLCVIGGGPAGYAAAMRALDLGMRTLLIEKDRIGGTGIYNGALTSKTLWEISQRVANANDMVRLRGREPFHPGWEEISRAVNEAAFERKYLYACHMQLLENQSDQFRHARGKAAFIDAHTVEISMGDKRTRISADDFILATGSRPRKLPNIQVDEQRVLTSDGIFQIADLPESIVIIGAGVIGCEFATIFSLLGRTRVHLIDRAERILPFEDEDVSELISRNFENQGVIVHRCAKLDHLRTCSDRVEYGLSYAQGSPETVTVEMALLSVGRVPNTFGLGLEHIGIPVDPNTGAIALEGTRTVLPHIHVVGDATGSNMLVNLGELEGRKAVEQLAGATTTPVSYDHVSSIMFLDPEVAGVGMNESELRRKGISYRMARIDYSCLARAIAMRRTQGFFKLIVSDDEHMKVLGMRAVGEHASSAIQAVALLMHMDQGIAHLAELVHPHPSIIEGVQECARLLLGTSQFKPAAFGDRMRCENWRPTPSKVQAA
ncbi:MAG: NAD(P)/FAD-dependent oxidoreductase [Flavobacteriales bacterium]|nr:NAD(P)/FAD-dependent oxidoreductase [Flavobacteriales bacterium]